MEILLEQITSMSQTNIPVALQIQNSDSNFRFVPWDFYRILDHSKWFYIGILKHLEF